MGDLLAKVALNKIGGYSVGESLVGIKKVSKVSYDKNEGFYYNYTTGVKTANATSVCTSLIEVQNGNVYKVKKASSVVFFNSNMVFIKGTSIVTTDDYYVNIDDPNIKYIGFTFTTANQSLFDVSLDVGKTGKYEIDKTQMYVTNTLGIETIASGANIYAKENVVYGAYYDYATGVYTTNAQVNSSGLIEVNQGVTLEKNVAGHVAFFDASLNFVSGLILTTIPSKFTIEDKRIKYVSFSFSYLIDINKIELKYLSGDIDLYEATNKLKFTNSHLTDTINKIRGLPANSETFLRIPTPYEDGTVWEGSNNQSTHPSVVKFATAWNGFKYWMVHTPYPFQNDAFENPCIAVSNDGVKWEVPVGLTNPLVAKPADGYNSDGHIFYNDSTAKLEMWYRAVTENSTVETLKRLTSSDGVTWSAVETMLESRNQGSVLKLIAPSVIYENSKYRMWVMRDWYVHLLESTNGTTWSDLGRVKSVGKDIHTWHPNIQKYNGIYYMLNCDKYTNQGKGGELKYTTSLDGVNWSKERHVLTFTGNVWDYDGYGVYRSSLIIEDDHIKILYGMFTNNKTDQPIWTIGMTSGKDIDSLRGMDDRALSHYGVL